MTVMKKRLRPSTRTNLDAQILEVAELKSQAAALKEQIDALQPKIIAALDKKEQKSRSVTMDDGKVVTATVVKGETVATDYDMLAKRVGTRVWTKITKRVIDPSKLEEAVANEVVSANDIADVSTIVPKAPYVKVTKK
jgi:hypothetical protein